MRAGQAQVTLKFSADWIIRLNCAVCVSKSAKLKALWRKFPKIKTAVVKIVKIKGIEHLCAYFTAEKLIDIETLKAELAKTLPKYMVPTAYLQMEKMPMTLNGKIDLKSLPEATIFRSGTTSKAANKVEEDFAKFSARFFKLRTSAQMNRSSIWAGLRF